MCKRGNGAGGASVHKKVDWGPDNEWFNSNGHILFDESDFHYRKSFCSIKSL